MSRETLRLNPDAMSKRLEREDAEAVIASPQARRFLFRFLKNQGMWNQDHGSEAHVLIKQGARNAGLAILDALKAVEPRAHQLILDEEQNISRIAPVPTQRDPYDPDPDE